MDPRAVQISLKSKMLSSFPKLGNSEATHLISKNLTLLALPVLVRKLGVMAAENVVWAADSKVYIPMPCDDKFSGRVTVTTQRNVNERLESYQI